MPVRVFVYNFECDLANSIVITTKSVKNFCTRYDPRNADMPITGKNLQPIPIGDNSWLILSCDTLMGKKSRKWNINSFAEKTTFNARTLILEDSKL